MTGEPRNPGNSGETEHTPSEVERKFLVDINDIPEGTRPVSETMIYQAYVGIAEDGSETRVRMSVPRYSFNESKSFELTIKTKGDVSRGEQTIPISEAMYFALSDRRKREGSVITKKRLGIRYQDVLIELDVYDGDLSGLVIAEVEFNGETEAAKLANAAAFVPPEWFGPEVTDDSRFKNKNLALNGSPING